MNIKYDNEWNILEIIEVPSPLCTIDIPYCLVDEEQETYNQVIDKKVLKVLKLFQWSIQSEVIRNNDVVYQRLSNINIDRVWDFLTQSEYNSFSTPELWVVFDDKIKDLFS